MSRVVRSPRCKWCREPLGLASDGDFCDAVCNDAYWDDPECLHRELDSARAEADKLRARIRTVHEYLARSGLSSLERKRIAGLLDGRPRK